jgi:microtubule-associated protein 1
MLVEQQTDEASQELPIYLLVLIGQTFSKEEKKLVLERINSSLVSIGDSLASIKEELNIAVQSQLFDALNFEQENRIVYRNETNLELDVLVNATGKTLRTAFREFLQSPSKNKHFISATVDLNTNGDLSLQDTLFGYDDLHVLLNEEPIKKLLLNTENSIKLHLNARLIESNKNWRTLEKQHKNIHLIGQKVASADESTAAYGTFLSGLERMLNERGIESLMETGKLTGTLRINKPMLYIFPSREGDAAYFTINGYSMLINGGYDRVKPCFWTFVNMLSQIDSVLITHSDADALGGLASFFAKKSGRS